MTQEHQPPGVSWRDYVESRLSGIETAVRVANAEMNRRLEAMNEFREENRRNMAASVSRELHEADIRRLEGLVATEREARKTAEGSIATWRFIATMLGATGVGALLLALTALLR